MTSFEAANSSNPEKNENSDPEVQQWCGMETDGMRKAKCSLLLRPDCRYQPQIKSLPRQMLRIHHDQADAQKHHSVDFKGCSILQLEPVPADPGQQRTMPVTLTVGGKCFLTADNYRDFRVLMRTRKEAQELYMPPNGSLDWPGVRSFLTCPVCAKDAKVPKKHKHKKPSNKQYWMLFYPLLQMKQEETKMTLGTCTICRLTCVDCFARLVDGMQVTLPPADDYNVLPPATNMTSILDMLQHAGTASFLQRDSPRPQSHPEIHEPLDAWTLYCLWEHCGAWEALQHDYRQALANTMQVSTSSSDDGEKSDSINRQHHDPTTSFKSRMMGRPCGNVECRNVHGKPRADDPSKTCRLGVTCESCRSEYYCSRKCRRLAAQTTHACARNPGVLQTVTCDTCQRVAPYTEMKKCSHCRSVIYCSVECQRHGWEAGHKQKCRKKELE